MASAMWKTFVVVFGFISLVFAATLPEEFSIKARATDLNYPVSELMFSGTLHGVEVQLNGTAESIHAQFETLHPGLAAAYQEANHTIETRDIEKRYGIVPPLCNVQGWPRCDVATIRDGENYLRGLNGGCGVGPRSCTRISCSYNAAIYLCNDNPYTISPTCAYLANYAEDIIRACQWGDRRLMVTGQEFDTDGYNVIVRGDSC